MSTTTLKRLGYMELHYDPENVRHSASDPDIIDLARSIEGVGLIEPLVVRKNGDGYKLIAGHRRLTAIGHLIQIGKWSHDQPIDCLVRTGIDEQTATAMQLVENLHRKDLTPIEEYRGYLRLTTEHGWKVKQVAEATGISQAVIKARLSWSVLPDDRLEEFVTSLGIGNMTELAKLPTATRERIVAKKKVQPYDIDDAKAKLVRDKRIEQVGAEIDRRGMVLFVRKDETTYSDAKDDELPPELLDIRNAMKAKAEQEGRRFFRDYLGYVTSDDATAKIIGVLDSYPAGTVVETTKTKTSYYVWTIIDKPDNGPSTFTKDPAEMTDYERDVLAARQAHQAAVDAWLEARKAALAAWFEETKPGKLLSQAIYKTLCEWGVDEAEAREYKLVGDDDETTTVWEFARQNATNLALAFSKVAIDLDDETIYGFTVEHPEPQHISRNHYDDDGRYLGPPPAAEAGEVDDNLEYSDDGDEPED